MRQSGCHNLRLTQRAQSDNNGPDTNKLRLKHYKEPYTLKGRQEIKDEIMKMTGNRTGEFYDPVIHRQFNMLGEYLERYEKVVSGEHHVAGFRNSTTEPGESPVETTEESFTDESVDSLINEVEDFISREDKEQEDTNALLERLQIAQETIKELQVENEKASEDYFKMEQIMKQTYYEDLKRIQGELDEQKELLEKSRKSAKFWENRNKNLNSIVNTFIHSVSESNKEPLEAEECIEIGDNVQ